MRAYVGALLEYPDQDCGMRRGTPLGSMQNAPVERSKVVLAFPQESFDTCHSSHLVERKLHGM